MTIDIRGLEDIEQLSALAALADAEGHGMVSRLMTDWRSGVNRFDHPGEVVLVAVTPAGIVGVCGLNQDPFVSDPRVGRLRRLYVASAWRRNGIASALVGQLLERAGLWFDAIHVRTYDPGAIAFYRSLGFGDVHGDSACTLTRKVAA